MGGSPGLVVMGDDSWLRGCGFESRRHILDGIKKFSHWFFCKNCIDVCLKRPKIIRKRGRVGPFKKKNKQPNCIRMCVSAFIKYAALTELVIKVQRINDFSSLYWKKYWNILIGMVNRCRSGTRLGNLFHFGQLFKVCGNNFFHFSSEIIFGQLL